MYAQRYPGYIGRVYAQRYPGYIGRHIAQYTTRDTYPGRHIAQYTPYVLPGMYTLVCTTPYHPGYTPPCTLSGMVNVPVDTLSAVLTPWAQDGRNPWVRSLSGTLDLQRCEGWKEAMRRVTPVFQEGMLKDWIATGTIPI